MCPHTPPCPAAQQPDREAARVVSGHPEQGWSLLCNGLIAFEDTGSLLPDCSVVAPHRGTAGRSAATAESGYLPEQRRGREHRGAHAA
jgi:hypothetical protein